MTEEWLIDGYNLLHGLNSEAAQKGKPSDRSALLSEAADFASRIEQRVLLVLDGSGPQHELDSYHTAFFRVVYSQKISADSYIERTLFERRSEVRFMVVTNDRAISNIARGGGARVMSTSQFIEKMRDCKKESSSAQDKNDIRSHGFHRPFEDKLKDL